MLLLDDAPFHFLIKVLKALRFSAVLILTLYCMNYYNKMQKNYSAWFQQLIIIRKSLTLNFLILRLPLGVFWVCCLQATICSKGKNNAILLLEQASKYFALSKNLTNRRLTSNEGYMKWTMYDIYLYIIWYIHTNIHIYDHVYHIVIYTHQNIIQIYLCTCIYNIIHRYIYR